jgi:hypothetical protein
MENGSNNRHEAKTAMRRLTQFREKLRRDRKRWILYVGIAFFAVAIEQGGELLNAIGISNPSNATIFPSLLYHKFATAGYRKPRPHFVRLVTLSPSSEPAELFGDACKKREFVAALLKRVMEDSPSLVVLHFWYPEYCNKAREDMDRHRKLETAISSASEHFPVVVGLSSHTLDEMEKEHDPYVKDLEKAGFGRSDLLLDNNVQFSGKNISYAILRLNADNRRIPIFWFAYENRSAVMTKSKPNRYDALPYIVAREHDRQVPELLTKITAANELPFTSFISESRFQAISGIDLLCGRTLSPEEEWRDCKPPNRADSRFDLLKGGHIIMIVENTERDHNESPLGNVPGYVLQANYIESLLDDRYFRPTPPVLEFIFSLIGAFIIVFVFENNVSPHVGFAKALAVVAGVAASCNLIAIYAGWFLGFWLSMLSITVVEWIFEWRIQIAARKSGKDSVASA